MTNYRFAFYVSAKPRTQALARIVAEGARVHGDTVELISQDHYEGNWEGYDGVAVLGIARASARLYYDCRKAKKHYVLFDKGYIDRDNYLRVSVDDWQPLAYFQRPGQGNTDVRLNKHLSKRKLLIQERKLSGPHSKILIAGTCQAHGNYHQIGDVTEYHTEVVNCLRKYTRRPITYRPNPSWYYNHQSEYRPIEGVSLSVPTTPFMQELKDCHLVVTHGSSASFHAFAAGVPVMTLGGGITRGVGLTNEALADVDTPYWPPGDLPNLFFRDASYCQWTYAEYNSGEAWANLREVFAYLKRTKSW